MRITINGHEYHIAGWFVEKEGIIDKSATVGRETEKAYLLQFSTGSEQWIPKSVLSDVAETDKSLGDFE